jgi:O-acetyl-ADP-ribose deacetylase
LYGASQQTPTDETRLRPRHAKWLRLGGFFFLLWRQKMTHISILQGNITTQQVDAIVNAANKSLLGGGGVDGAIHAAAGPQLLQECRTLGGCQTGQAKLTKGYNLPAKYIIHTVGPIYGSENGKEAELLADCYKNSLSLAVQYQCQTIAFPAISTGIYGFPKEEAAKIVKRTLEDFIHENDSLKEIRLVLYSEEDRQLYENIFSQP